MLQLVDKDPDECPRGAQEVLDAVSDWLSATASSAWDAVARHQGMMLRFAASLPDGEPWGRRRIGHGLTLARWVIGGYGATMICQGSAQARHVVKPPCESRIAGIHTRIVDGPRLAHAWYGRSGTSLGVEPSRGTGLSCR
jgi:hypothetical protein